MLNYFAKRPLHSAGLGMLGLALLVAGVITMPANQPLPALAQEKGACNDVPNDADDVKYSTDRVYNGQWHTNWKARRWLVYQPDGSGTRFPIGVDTWRVAGRLRDMNGQETCFTEKWEISRVIIASTRRNNKGSVISRGSFDGSRGLTTEAVNYMRSDNTTKTDGAFRDNNDWNPVGLYGALRTSKDSLHESVSFFPVEWSITGQLDVD